MKEHKETEPAELEQEPKYLYFCGGIRPLPPLPPLPSDQKKTECPE